MRGTGTSVSQSAEITVTLIDDTLFEGDETVELTLGAPTGGVAGTTQQTHTFTIVDDEAAPEVVFSMATGTSLGTLIICTPLLYPAGAALGVDPMFLGGALLAGATFGLAGVIQFSRLGQGDPTVSIGPPKPQNP